MVQNKRVVYTSKGNDIDKKYRTGSRLKLAAFRTMQPGSNALSPLNDEYKIMYIRTIINVLNSRFETKN